MGEITKIEKYIIEKVKEKRNELGISQIALNALAKIFKGSPRDFLPEKPL